MGALHNKKWEIACRAYVLEGLTKTDAYLRGFPLAIKKKRPTLHAAATDFFKGKRIIKRVAELQVLKSEVAAKEFSVDAAYILRRLVDIDRMDIADILDEEAGFLKPVKEWPVIWRQFISQFEVEEIFAGRGEDRLNIGLLKKIKWPDKVRNLELLGKHVNVSAFKETLEHTGAGGGPLRVVAGGMSEQEAAEAYADTLKDG